MEKTRNRLWIALFVLAFLSPVGIILPEKFKAGDAWGEWGTDTLKQLLGYVPTGLEKYAEIWRAPIPDYNFWGEGAAMSQQIIAYIVSGLLGILMTASVVYILSKVIFRRER
ncbi:MAG: Fused nickel transport protein NikMN [Syntrophus sp. PtaB.Bin001]|nr:MAG: Fused nickel transport protein NikMN [Syntrophus sp. PtaB.Bin001]